MKIMERKRALFQILSSSLVVLFLSLSCQHVDIKDRSAETNKEELCLVGMGPGDPDLATFRAIDIVQKADLIICSRSLKERFSRDIKNKRVLSPPENVWIWHGYGKKVTDFQGEEVEKFQASEKARSQIITEVRRAIKNRKRVAILDHADPLIYGPWSWILEEFEDLSPTVVPGLSSFNAANAALKKGVTSGRRTKSVILTMPDLPEMSKKDTIEKLAGHQATMVIFMPTVRNTKLKDLVAKLSTHYSPQTPIALVACAGYQEKERVIRGTLENIVNKLGNQSLPFEHLIYVGDFLTHEMKLEKGE